MRIHAATASVIGSSTSSVWTQIISTAKGYAVIEIENSLSSDSTTLGNHIAAQLVDAFADPPIALSEIEKLAKDCLRQGVTSIAILIPVGNVAYIVVHGDGAAYLKRGGLLARLIDGNGSVSGEISIGDTIVLVSKTLRSHLPENQLSSSFDHYHANELAEKLTLLLHQGGDEFSGAALVFEGIDFMEEDQSPDVIHEETRAYIRTTHPWHSVFSKQRLIRLYRRVRNGQIPSRTEIHTRFSGLDGQSKYVLLGIAIIAGMLFLVSVILGVRKVASFGLSSETKLTVTQAQKVFEEGIALRDLNPIESRNKIGQAKSLLDPIILKISQTSADGRKVVALYKEISESYTLAMHKNSVIPEMFYDVSLLRKGAAAHSIGISGDTLVLVDSTASTVYAVNTLTKNGQVVIGSDIVGGALSADSGGDSIYTYAARGIYKTSLGSKPTKEPIIKKDDAWGTITKLIYFGGNIYLLDTTKSRIWKYVATETGFTERREYLNPDTLPDFSIATSLAIDGTVWVGSIDGKIHKFIQGKEETFIPVGVEPKFVGSVSVYTDDVANNLYVLDATNNRVVALDKEGVYIAQYQWEGTIKPTDIVVSEKQKTIFLLADGIVYSIGLK